MTDLATLETRLSEAESALHSLQVGRRTVSVRQADGRTVDYANSASQVRDLKAYITELKQSIARKKGRAAGGPIQLWPR